MIFAEITNGVVTNRYHADEPRLPEHVHAESCEEGWLYQNGSFYPPIPVMKKAKAAEIVAACKTSNTQGFLSTALDGANQYRYSTDNVFGDSSNENIDMLFLSAAYSKAVNNVATPAWTIQYPCKGPSDTDYKLYAHTAAQMIAVGDAGFAFIQANRINMRTKLGQVRAASTIDDIQAVTW